MIVDLLKSAFVAKHATAAVKHFTDAVDEFEQNQWDDASAKGGKCIEAVLKALWAFTGEAVPTGKAFKANGT